MLVGDGATSEGDMHEALNFAGAPEGLVVFLVQNNGYAISVPLAEQTAAPALAYRGVGYGVRSTPGTTPPRSSPPSSPASRAAWLRPDPHRGRHLPDRGAATPMTRRATGPVRRSRRGWPGIRSGGWKTTCASAACSTTLAVARISAAAEQQVADLREAMSGEVKQPAESFVHVYAGHPGPAG